MNNEEKIITEEIESDVTVSDADKKEKKEISAKSLVFRCIAGVLCTVIACVSITNSVSKLADAKVKVAELTPVTRAVQTSGNVGSYESRGGESFAVSGADSITSDDNGSSSSTSFEVPTSESNASKPTEPSQMSKAQVVALFNNSANGAKANAKSIKQNYSRNSQVSSIELKSKSLASLADRLIKANMGDDKTKANKVYTGADKAKFFPVAGQSWSSKLTEADVKDASINESNGTYNVVIKLVDDITPNLKAGEGHAGKAFSLVTKEQIVEGAGSAGMAVIKEESIKVTHSGCVIKVTIDKATGKLKTANYYRVWKLQLTAIGIDVGISFGIEEDYVINW